MRLCKQRLQIWTIYSSLVSPRMDIEKDIGKATKIDAGFQGDKDLGVLFDSEGICLKEKH